MALAASILLFVVGLIMWLLFADRVELVGAAAGLPSTAVVRGRRGSDCFAFEKGAGPKARFWNVLSPGTCPTELFGFGESRAMGARLSEVPFTDQTGDNVPLPMAAPPLVVDVNVFILIGDRDTFSVPDRQDRASNAVRRANQIFGTAQCGVAFNLAINKDETADPANSDRLVRSTCVDNDPAFNAIDPPLTSKPGVKVFYIDDPDGAAGHTCRDGATAMILIAYASTDETLAHELGHALSLDHPVAADGMPVENVMFSPASVPGSLTLGQCFRSNMSGESVLNRSSIRTGQTRPCTAGAGDCPPLKFGT